MVDKNDAEIYYNMAREKTDVLEKMYYALLSIANSLIKRENVEEPMRDIEDSRISGNEIHGVDETNPTLLSSSHMSCEYCGNAIEIISGEEVYYFDNYAFCTDDCRYGYRESKRYSENKAQSQQSQKPKSKSNIGEVL